MLLQLANEDKTTVDDLRRGNVSEAFEAAKAVAKLPRLSVKKIIEVLAQAKDVYNREAAVYALSWVLRRNSDEVLKALLTIFDDVNEHPIVRAQAIEGVGMQGVTKRFKSWREVEGAVLRGLNDKAVEVRFWSCYAAGELKVDSALPQLRRLAENDFAICPKWWRVSKEATDAIEWIHERETKARLLRSNQA